MKWSEIRRIAEGKGWYLVRHGANHDIYKHPSIKDMLIIERHDSTEIRPGLLNKLKKKLDIYD